MGADRLHVVVVADDGSVGGSAVIDPADTAAVDALLGTLPPACPVGIDGPAGPSAGAHVDDASLSRKFRPARGCEIELGRRRGLWVPWVTPLEGHEMAPWMGVAVGLHRRVADHGLVPLETYPYAVFVALTGARPPRKTTPAGLAARAAALRSAGLLAPHLELWSHDALDAAACAVVARAHRLGSAAAISDDRDGTCIWLPA